MTKRSPTSAEAASGHPISVVAERTGLTRDVLRVWERRYSAVEPLRTPGGQRLYSNEHIERFRLLAAATRHGRNISLVAGLSTEALQKLVAEDDAERLPTAPDAQPAHEDLTDAALAHTFALDGTALDRELRRIIARHGLPRFLEDVAPTLMHRVGEAWEVGRLGIAHEHLASAAVLAIILEAMRSVPEAPGAPKLLVATPSSERHAVGAALAAAAAALDGWAIIYLGVDVPAADIAAASRAGNARAVAVSVVHAVDPDHVVRELHALRATLGADVPVMVGGATAVRLSARITKPGLTVCGGIADMRRLLSLDTVSA
jgi:DNA-binding transcriptional MerR regulator/methylmalonyl-CoA mutase cobalamin-binding subunit